MSAKEKVLVLLYYSKSWVDEETLRGWVEYSNPSMFKGVLEECHKKKLLEYDAKGRRAMLSPTGIDFVETQMSLTI
jgi:hypothetical protein